jgi:hypothetical protein
MAVVLSRLRRLPRNFSLLLAIIVQIFVRVSDFLNTETIKIAFYFARNIVVIEMKQPSLALHSCDFPGRDYRMKFSWRMPANATVQNVVNWILYAVDHSEELELKNVVLCAHGLPGLMAIGGADLIQKFIDSRKDGTPIPPTILTADNVAVFSQLRTKDIGTIWLVSCLVAGTGQCYVSPVPCDGPYFCSQLAQAAGCDVVASQNIQVVLPSVFGLFVPSGSIDDLEGRVRRFSPSGSSRDGYDPDSAGEWL